MDEVSDALDEVDDTLAVVVPQIAGLDVALTVKNLSNRIRRSDFVVVVLLNPRILSLICLKLHG